MLLWVVITCRPLVMEQSCAEHFILFIKSSCLFCDGWGSWDRETKVTLLGDTAWICSQVSQVPNFAYHPWVSDMGRVWVPSFHFCFLQNSFFLKKYSLHLFVHPGERSPEPSFLCAVFLTPKAKGRGGCIKTMPLTAVPAITSGPSPSTVLWPFSPGRLLHARAVGCGAKRASKWGFAVF